MKRRKFLQTSGHLAMSSAYFYGAQAFLDLCLQTNMAQAQISSGINYLNIQLPGAPPRWLFDQPLNPYNNGSDFKAGLFGTRIVKRDQSFRAVHRGNKINFGGRELFMPPVWSLKSAANGKAFQDLLDHTIMIRGVDMEINSHTVNRSRIVRPVTNRPSIHGLVADKSDLPLAAIGSAGSEATEAFKGESGMSIVQVSPNRTVQDLTQSFMGQVAKASELSTAETGTVEALDDYARKKGLASMGSEKQQMAAYEMFERNLPAFTERWQTHYDKYKNIADKEIRAPFPGITSADPISDGSELFRYNRGTNNIMTGSLKGKITNSSGNNQLIHAFALAEFALTEKLSSSLSVDISSATLRSLQQIGTLVNDQHNVGAVVSTFYTSLMYRAFISCLMELVDTLKANGLFDNTVIHIMSEFSRTPRRNGSGSDHGFRGASTTIISGMISTPGLLGNIRKEAQDPEFRQRYPGTWGEAAPFFAGSNRNLVNDDVVNTICEMLEIKKIAVKGQPLIRKVGGRAEFLQNWGIKNV